MTGTVDEGEARHFGGLAADWWNPHGSSAMLHKLNPVRLSYIRERIDRHFGADPSDFRPLAGKSALDIGCGAGLLTEPLARLGAKVTGIDAASENIKAARAHAEQSGLAIEYRDGDFLDMELGQFDLITAMEVIEHVTEPIRFLAGLALRLAPGGLLILSTPNRTAASRLLLVEAAERLGQVPRGTHDWNKFIMPAEMDELATACGLSLIDRTGIGFSPARGLILSDNLDLNYIMTLEGAAPQEKL